MARKRQHGSTWTAEKDARLTELWASGMIAAKIGVELKVSKYSVLARAHRLELPSRPSSISIAAERRLGQRLPTRGEHYHCPTLAELVPLASLGQC